VPRATIFALTAALMLPVAVFYRPGRDGGGGTDGT